MKNSEETTHDVSLSVVIPTYRRAARLDRLLTALEPQVAGRTGRRVVVVNDGSHDDAYAKVAERFQSIIEYIALPKNVGCAAARSAGVRTAKGRYLVFTDDDCVPPPHWLDWLVANLQEHPYVGVVGGPTRPLPSNSPGLVERHTEATGNCPKPCFYNGLLQFVPAANAVIRRDWYDRAGGFDDRFGEWGEDMNLTYRLKICRAPFLIDWSWFTYHDQAWSLSTFCDRSMKYGCGKGLHKGVTNDPSIPEKIPTSYVSVILGMPGMIGSIWRQFFKSGQPGYLLFTYCALKFLGNSLFQFGLRRGYKRALELGNGIEPSNGRELNAGHSPPRPNLFIIGAMKSGTSSLHRYLGAHPSIFMCTPREPKFFATAIEFDNPRMRASQEGVDNYLRLFAAAGDATIVGESSTDYSKLPRTANVPRRIADFNPDARIIYLMRDPVERSISHYWFEVRHLSETRDILKAVQEDLHYRAVSHYAMQLAPYFELFDSNQIKILTMEELDSDPLGVVRGLYEWLGVDASFVPLNVNQRWNVTPTILHQVKDIPGLRRLLKSRLLRTIGRIVPSPLLSAGRRMSVKTVDRTSVSVSEVVDYLRPIQQAQTQELGRLLGRDFPEWATLHGTAGSPGAGKSRASRSSGPHDILWPSMSYSVVIKRWSRLGKLLFRRKLWGYYVESELAMRTIFRRELPAPRFLIFTQRHSGSRLLCELLGSHSQIHCDFEILAHPVRDVYRYLRCSALAATRPAHGFKFMFDHLTEQQKIDNVGGFLRRMHEDGWHIVYLMRRNLFRGVYSSLANEVRGNTRTRLLPDGSAPRRPIVHVDIKTIVHRMRRRQGLLHREQETLKGLPHKTLVYEDDLYEPSDQRRAVGDLVAWLGLAPETVHSTLIRNTPRNLRDVIANFDELKAGLQGTEFEADFREATGG